MSQQDLVNEVLTKLRAAPVSGTFDPSRVNPDDETPLLVESLPGIVVWSEMGDSQVKEIGTEAIAHLWGNWAVGADVYWPISDAQARPEVRARWSTEWAAARDLVRVALQELEVAAPFRSLKWGRTVRAPIGVLGGSYMMTTYTLSERSYGE